MPDLAQILAIVAALIHILFFYLESIAFTKPAIAKTFGASTPEETELLKGIFLNQGFYNLFLAIGVIAGVAISASSTDPSTDQGIVYGSSFAMHAYSYGIGAVFLGLACMVGAAIVLLVSSKGQMLRGALIQGVVPLVGLLVLAFA